MDKAHSLLLPWIPWIPLFGALLVAVARGGERMRRVWFLMGTLPALLLCGALAAKVVTPPASRPLVLVAWGGYLYADGLTVIMLCCIYLLVLAAGIYSFAYMERQRERQRVTEGGLRLYYSILLVFCASMSWTVTFNNLVFMFLAIEVSTIVTALLVSLYRSRQSLEAAFKYNLLVVMAILFALMGTIIIFGRLSATLPGLSAIHLTEIGRSAPLLPASVALPVVAFMVCAFGTEAGMIPFHAWLPDAHSEAPAPISALLSGIVITIGAYCLARTVTLFSPRFPSVVVLVAAIASASIVIGILMAIAQDDLKRLLAYSSVSQISYIFEGLGLGTYLGIYSGLFHAVTHMLTKSLLFFCVGAIVYRLGLRKISDLGGLARKMPVTAVCFFVGGLSMGGMPPLAGFPSKASIILAVGQSRLWWAMGISAFAGLLTLACLVWAAWRVFWGEESAAVQALPADERDVPATMKVPMVVVAVCVVVLGLAPQLLYPVLDSAARTILALAAGGLP
jgi:hydrogenase-4 component F